MSAGLEKVMTPIKPRDLEGDIGHWWSVGFGLGLSPWAPGTVGSLLALPLAYMTHVWSFWSQLCFVGLMWVGSVWAAGRLASVLNQSDPSAIVSDEVVAMWIVSSVIWWMGGMHPVWGQCLGFTLFRLFDIVKPWPISACERIPSVAWAIMLDDLAAAILSCLVYYMIYVAII